jgi:hypothetical protein
MAEFEELKVTIKAPDSEETKKAIEATKSGFREIAAGPHAEGMKAVGRSVSELEGSIKTLIASVGSGDAFKAISMLGSTFGKAGTVGIAVAGVAELINATVQFATNQARSMATLADQARRVGIHPAQLLKEIEQARLATPEISAERMLSIVQHLHERMVQIGVMRLPEARERLMQFDRDPQVRELKMDLINQMIVAPQAEQLNLVVEGAQKLIKYYADQGFPPSVGRLKAEEWAKELTGSVDILRVNDKFAQVSEEDKALMDSMVESSRAWLVLTGGMANDFESIVRLVGVGLMNDPVFGGIIKFIGAAARAESEIQEEKILGKEPERPWWWGPKLGPRVRGTTPLAPSLSHYLDLIYRTYKILRESNDGTSQQHHLLDLPQGLLDKQSDETQDLIAQFRRLNALLSGEEKPIQRLPLHNQPMGGAAGESNPLVLSPNASQPGGGAAAEAQKEVSIRDQARQALTEIRASQGTPAPGIPLPERRPPAASIRVETAGPLAALGASYAGPRTYSFDDPRITSESAKKYLRENRTGSYGFAYTGGPSPEAYYAPGSGQEITTMAHEYEHVGRAAVQTAALASRSLEPNIFKRYEAYVQPSFASSAGGTIEERQQRYQEILTSRQLLETGQISPKEQKESLEEAQSYLRGAPPGEREEAFRHSRAQERFAQLMLASPVWSRASGDTEKEEREAVDLPPMEGANKADRNRLDRDIESRGRESQAQDTELSRSLGADLIGRSSLDSGLAREHDVDASGDLNVSVKAPAGTEVKAEGDGMFKDNVSLDRQMELPAAI